MSKRKILLREQWLDVEEEEYTLESNDGMNVEKDEGVMMAWLSISSCDTDATESNDDTTNAEKDGTFERVMLA